jgi:tagatose-1,6-bisphosphate aldolase non-catalytic subunit AgaZ/GatZ
VYIFKQGEQMQTGEILTLIGLIIATPSIIFAILQWRESNKMRRAEFINQIIMKIRFDKNLAKTIYMLDKGNRWYDDKFYGSEKEMEIDALFSYLTYIRYLYDTKNIRKNEYCIFEYEIKMVCSDKQTQEYLWNLYHLSKQSLNTKCSFQNLIDYLRNNVLSTEQKTKFDNPDSEWI